ncbi:branched-chain amino acid ABC transporter permease [Allopusillimonas ginsengisoli]|uniref:branched-chain amino acid ABC transporter permease n=1 Tax=Allopusillimonas ginsengisoli TaxID=453575 RepID=UPI0039C42B13
MSSATSVIPASSSPRSSLGTVVGIVLLIALALVPLLASTDPFVVTLFSRILVFAIAAVSLNLILGYGGLVSFGHALYLGLGVYSASILSFHGIDNGWIQLLVTLVVCCLIGLLTGAIVLRTTGIAFIMITLAFAQMFYFLFVSLSQYGGDDGMRLASGSKFSGIDLAQANTLYWVAFVILCVSLYGTQRVIHSRFGVVLRASKSNDRRMKALGFPTFRYRLAAYVMSAALCGVAGLLFANLTEFASPSYMSWTTSGELIVMVMLGGLGTLFGPLVGSLAMILTEEGLKMLTQHWMVIFGPLIVLVVTVSRQGIIGVLHIVQDRHAQRSVRPDHPVREQP